MPTPIPLTEQERNLRRLSRALLLGLIVAGGFVCWWLYQGVGYFKDEMSFSSALGPRKGPRLPLPPGTVPRDGMGYDRAQLGEAAVGAAYVPAQGAKLYHDQCGFCHASSGLGDTAVGMEYDPRPPDLNQVVPQRSDAALYAAISDGMATPEVNTNPPIGPRWHAFRLYLAETDRRTLVQYLRHTFGGGRAPAGPRATEILSPAYHIVGNPPAAQVEGKLAGKGTGKGTGKRRHR